MNSSSAIVHSFKVKFTQFSSNNVLDLDPSSTIVVRQDRSVQIIPDDYQSSKQIVTVKKRVDTGLRTAYTGKITRTNEVGGNVKKFEAFMDFWAGGDLMVDFDTKDVGIRVSGSGVPTVENIVGQVV